MIVRSLAGRHALLTPEGGSVRCLLNLLYLRENIQLGALRIFNVKMKNDKRLGPGQIKRLRNKIFLRKVCVNQLHICAIHSSPSVTQYECKRRLARSKKHRPCCDSHPWRVTYLLSILVAHIKAHRQRHQKRHLNMPSETNPGLVLTTRTTSDRNVLLTIK